jgi:hypothetical protein
MKNAMVCAGRRGGNVIYAAVVAKISRSWVPLATSPATRGFCNNRPKIKDLNDSRLNGI